MNTSFSPRRASRLLLQSSVALGALMAALTAGPAVADDVSTLASRLAGVRGEVETLSAQLSEKTQDLQDQLRSQARQKAELELEVQRERSRLQKVRISVTEQQKLISEEQAAGQELQPFYERNLEAIRAHVKTSLPFRTAERLAELDKIDEQVKSGLLPPQRAIMRLWTFIEDEFRMTRENGLFRQTITVEGQEQLADVIRIGTIALYFRTGDDRVGYVEKAGSGWEYKETADKEDRRRLLGLFDSFKKQIRVGFFELPNALPVGQ